MTVQKRKLPEGWKWIKLGELCGFNYGSGLPLEIRQEGKIPVYGSNGIVGYHNKPLTQGSTIIIGRKGSIGEVHYSLSPCWPIDTTYYIEKTQLDTDFQWLYYWLQALDLRSMNKAAAVPGLNRNDAYRIELPLPPLPEQKRIAAILNERMTAIDKARTATQGQLEAAKALPSAYLRQVFSSPEAQKWPKKRLGEVCKIVAKQIDPKINKYGELPHVSGENIESGTCKLKTIRSAVEDGMTSGKYLFESGNVLYSKLRPYLRKVALVNFSGVCSADMYPIKVDIDELDPQFTAWMLLSEGFTKYADAESRRARMPKLNREQLFAWEAYFPSLPEQKRIASQLNEQIGKGQALQKELESQLEILNKLPAALLGQAFRGEL